MSASVSRSVSFLAALSWPCACLLSACCCEGLEPPPPAGEPVELAHCAPLQPPPDPTEPPTLDASLEATPAWARDSPASSTAARLKEGAVPIPQPDADLIRPQSAESPGPGAALLCRVSVSDTTDEGSYAVTLRVKDQPPVLHSADEPTFTFSAPGVALDEGTPISLEVVRHLTTCKGLNKTLILFGLPVPNCRTRQTQLGALRGVWPSDASWTLSKGSVTVSCDAASWRTLAPEVELALSRSDQDADRLCQHSRLDPNAADSGWGLRSSDLGSARDGLWRAAGLVGWADPRVQARDERLSAIEADFQEEVAAWFDRHADAPSEASIVPDALRVSVSAPLTCNPKLARKFGYGSPEQGYEACSFELTYENLSQAPFDLGCANVSLDDASVDPPVVLLPRLPSARATCASFSVSEGEVLQAPDRAPVPPGQSARASFYLTLPKGRASAPLLLFSTPQGAVPLSLP